MSLSRSRPKGILLGFFRVVVLELYGCGFDVGLNVNGEVRDDEVEQVGIKLVGVLRWLHWNGVLASTSELARFGVWGGWVGSLLRLSLSEKVSVESGI